MKNEVKLLIDSYRSVWINTRCIVMCDGWLDGRHRSLIYFLIYYPKGIAFIKSVDGLAIVANAQLLCNFFFLNMVGAQNVVHLVTDNGSNS